MSASNPETVLVTGACGHIGNQVSRRLRSLGTPFVATDMHPADETVVKCDLRNSNQVRELFQTNSIRGVIHLAAILPTAFHSDPLTAVDTNLSASFELVRQAVKARVRRFVFASSMSVYGVEFDPRARTEEDPASPEDPYGAAKRVVEVVGESLAKTEAIEFVSLRIARAIGPGARKTSSPWRSQIFERSSADPPIQIPFNPSAILSVVHVEDIARMLLMLIEAPQLSFSTYNTPAESWEVGELKAVVEKSRGSRVEVGPGPTHGGPLCDGRRFSREFGFHLKGLRERLSAD